MWRITLEVVARYKDMANFKATRHTMWIQPRRDPDKQWLQMRYCITEGDIDLVIKYWEDEWRIPVLTWELSERITEEEVGKEETQPQEIQVPKKQRHNKDGDPEGEEEEYAIGQRETEAGRGHAREDNKSQLTRTRGK
jgi:hypothetical protein